MFFHFKCLKWLILGIFNIFKLILNKRLSLGSGKKIACLLLLLKIVNRTYNSFLVFTNHVSSAKNSSDTCMNHHSCNMNDRRLHVTNELLFDRHRLLPCVGRNTPMSKHIFLYSFEFISKSYRTFSKVLTWGKVYQFISHRAQC